MCNKVVNIKYDCIFFFEDANLSVCQQEPFDEDERQRCLCVNPLIKENAASIICSKMISGIPARSCDIMSKLTQHKDSFIVCKFYVK